MELNGIKGVLDGKAIKQVWLAEKPGKSFSMVNAYAQNRSRPSMETLYQLAEILQASVRNLLVENKKENK